MRSAKTLQRALYFVSLIRLYHETEIKEKGIGFNALKEIRYGRADRVDLWKVQTIDKVINEVFNEEGEKL
jgi:hypothetical protein